MKKRAQTSLISIILIVLIGIVLIMLLFNVVIPIVKKGNEVNNEVFSVKLDVKEAIIFYTGASKISIQRGSGNEDINSLKFVFYNSSGDSFIENINTNIPLEFETKTYLFKPIESFGKISRISIYPVFENKIGLEFKSKDYLLEVPLGLVSWYRLNENSKDFYDGNDCLGEISFNENGSYFNENYLNCGNSNSLNILKDFTIVIFIKTNSDNSELITKNGNYKISIENGKIKFSYWKDNIPSSFFGITNISDNNWHSVIVNNQMVYVDGKTERTVFMDLIDSSNENMFIGKGFNGNLKEIMIFNVSLSKEQISGLISNLA